MRRGRVLDRFAADAVSMPLWLRVAITVPVVYVGYVLVKSFVLAVKDGAIGAAMLLFILGIFLFYAVPLLRVLWKPSAGWRYDKNRSEAEIRRFRELANRDLKREATGRTFGAQVIDRSLR